MKRTAGRTRQLFVFALGLLLVLVVPTASALGVGITSRASVDSASAQGNGASGSPGCSADGRYVVFDSSATNLVIGDTNGTTDVFMRDRLTGNTSRVSLNSSFAQGNGYSQAAAISANGRYVAFWSSSTNFDLVTPDTNGAWDVFVRDTLTGTTTRVNLDSSGAQSNAVIEAGYIKPAISADGRFVAFESSASNLVSSDTNGVDDVFLRDTLNGTTTRVSVDSSNAQGNGESIHPSISANGQYVAFGSSASNLVSPDTNGSYDVFVRDTLGGTTTRVSDGLSGAQGNDSSYYPFISATGQYVAFMSAATNLVTGDTNNRWDAFVRDTVAGTTTRVSVGSGVPGTQGNDGGSDAHITPDGHYAVFVSDSTNLVSGDTNGKWDVFVRDMQAATTTRVSVNSSGAQADSAGSSGEAAISANGQFVVFPSGASNLVPSDTNGVNDVFVRDLLNDVDPSNLTYTDPSTGVTVGFSGVTSPGQVTVAAVPPAHNAPSNFSFLGNSYFNISTTAGYTGSITITFPVPPSYTGALSSLQVLHWELISPGVYDWKPYGVSAGSGTVTVTVPSFSDFAVAAPVVATPASSGWSLALLALAGLGVVTFVARKQPACE